MVDDPVDDRRGHLVVAEHRAPPRELEVGGEHDRLRLVGRRHHLEQQPRAVCVEGKEPQLVDDEQLRPPDLGELPVEPAFVAGAPEAHHQRRCREEARLDPRLAARRAQGRGRVRLAGAHVAHGHEVLPAPQEGQGQQVVAAEPVGP